jgi:hypothetical protein
VAGEYAFARAGTVPFLGGGEGFMISLRKWAIGCIVEKNALMTRNPPYKDVPRKVYVEYIVERLSCITK